MGLFSDYLEQCRSRCDIYDLDPCLVMDHNFVVRENVYNDIYNELTEYLTTKDNYEKIQLREKLIKESCELEHIKSGYIIEEKIILELKNRDKLQTNLMIDIINMIINELNKSYQAICDLRKEINHQLGKEIIIKFESPDENIIRKDMLNLICTSVVNRFYDESFIIPTEDFRKVVFDLAELIRCLEQEEYNQPDKKVVLYYLEKNLNLKYSYVKCENCGKMLFHDIPYCFNCYERN